MLDLGLTKMAVIGVVALVVLGPERLPRVARTAGALLGRAQRYISDVKDEVTREIELNELQKVKSEFAVAATNIENAIHENLREQKADLEVAWNGGSTQSPEAEQAAAPLPLPAPPDFASWRGDTATGTRRRNWRGKQAVTPTWYKRTAARRRHVQSVAARVARHASAYPAVRERFFNV